MIRPSEVGLELCPSSVSAGGHGLVHQHVPRAGRQSRHLRRQVVGGGVAVAQEEHPQRVRLGMGQRAGEQGRQGGAEHVPGRTGSHKGGLAERVSCLPDHEQAPVLLLVAARPAVPSAQHHQHGHHHGNDSTAGSANVHAQSSTEQPVSVSRDRARCAYQQPEKVLDLLGGSIRRKTVWTSARLAVKWCTRRPRDRRRCEQELRPTCVERIAKDRLDIELRLMLTTHPHLKDVKVDLVFLANTLPPHRDRAAYFRRRCGGAMKPGGELVIVDFFKADLLVGPPVDHQGPGPRSPS